MKTIGVIQVKGGAGRSTLATNLAGELAKVGQTVLIDGDMPQGTSASWYAMRKEAGKAGGTDTNLQADTAPDHRELIAEIKALLGIRDDAPKVEKARRKRTPVPRQKGTDKAWTPATRRSQEKGTGTGDHARSDSSRGQDLAQGDFRSRWRQDTPVST